MNQGTKLGKWIFESTSRKKSQKIILRILDLALFLLYIRGVMKFDKKADEPKRVATTE